MVCARHPFRPAAPPVRVALVVVAAAAAALTGAAGCATSAGATAAPVRRTNLTAADFYPLAPGWKWAYDLEKDGQKILAVYAVLERTGDTAVVQAGEERLTYAVTPEGIAQKEGGTVGDYVIRNPVTLGSVWPVAGGSAKVISVGQDVTVEAGRFTDCAIVEVTRADPVRIARTTFAPDVGWIVLEVQVQQGSGAFVTTTRAMLRGLTKPGQDLFR
jgi:hypothetical protein